MSRRALGVDAANVAVELGDSEPTDANVGADADLCPRRIVRTDIGALRLHVPN